MLCIYLTTGKKNLNYIFLVFNSKVSEKDNEIRIMQNKMLQIK